MQPFLLPRVRALLLIRSIRSTTRGPSDGRWEAPAPPGAGDAPSDRTRWVVELDASGRRLRAASPKMASQGNILVPPMPIEIDAFLAAYKPKFICLPCLSQVTAREPSDVRRVVDVLLSERRAESQAGECLNCSATAFVVRRR